jgi:PAS domain S-box-containing protein
MRDGNSQLIRLLDASIDMMCIAGFDGYFKWLNPAWERTLGWSREELYAEPWIDFVHPEDREKTLKAEAQLSAGQTVLLFENRYRTKNGSAEESFSTGSGAPGPSAGSMSPMSLQPRTGSWS